MINFKCIKDVYEILVDGVEVDFIMLLLLGVRIRVNFNFDIIEKLIFISGVEFFWYLDSWILYKVKDFVVYIKQ